MSLDESEASAISRPGADIDALPVGALIGRFKVTSVLGQGSFGITYAATDTSSGLEVAIKEYLPTALATRQSSTIVVPRSTQVAEDFVWARERFVSEGRILASLGRAPAIVRMLDFLEVNGTAYIVMERLHGATLEKRLVGRAVLSPEEIGRLLWPLLDGLEQVHSANYVHRDIKPSNILVDAAGNPTLIDFGASRFAMAGRTVAMTAIFTPGYAAPEQFSSAKQGPWTDIYSLSATLYHAITGATPPSSFDRILDDTYEPLSSLAPAGFASGILLGIDAGLAVHASDRPQSIASWRAILVQTGALDAAATVMFRKKVDHATLLASRPPAASNSKRGLWTGLAIAAALTLAGGGYYFTAATPSTASQIASTPSVAEKAAQEAQAATAAQRQKEQQEAQATAEAQRQKDLEELAKLRAESEARQKAEAEAEAKRKVDEEAAQKADAEAAVRRQAEEEAQRKAAAELAERKRIADEEKAKAEVDAETKRKADEKDVKLAEAVEARLNLALTDRQKIQVALTSVGFNTGGSDGAFGPRSRQMIATWQQKSGAAGTGFITAAQRDALLRSAAPAVTRWEEEQKKLEDEKKKTEEEKKKADEAKAKAEAEAKAKGKPEPSPSALTPGAGGERLLYSGTMVCKNIMGGAGSEFQVPISVVVMNGEGVGKNDSERGQYTFTVRISGKTAEASWAGMSPPPSQNLNFKVALKGTFENNQLFLTGLSPNSYNCRLNMSSIKVYQ